MFGTLFRERRRAGVVQSLALPDTPGDAALDRFVDAAAQAFDAPFAALSLIHDQSQLVKAANGVVPGCLPRGSGFCQFTIDQPGLLECCDPEADPRFAALPVVAGAPRLRYYIGAPLHLLSGIDVGTLCVADTALRAPASEDQKAYLLGLARQASAVLDARLAIRGHAA